MQVTSPKGGLFAKLFRKHNRVSRDVRITVSDIIVPQDIVCDKNNLFSILYGDKLYSQSEFPVEAHINDMAQPFQLLFHQAEIKDCIKPQDENPRSYSIHFTVNLTDLKGKVIVFPTDTVYGLCARSDSEVAINKIYELIFNNIKIIFLI